MAKIIIYISKNYNLQSAINEAVLGGLNVVKAVDDLHAMIVDLTPEQEKLTFEELLSSVKEKGSANRNK